MGIRYFSATAYAGQLYVQGVLDRAAWDTRQLVYWEESQVDAILNARVGDRKVHTAQELRIAVEASRVRHQAIKVWIAEGLEEAARVIWKESH